MLLYLLLQTAKAKGQNMSWILDKNKQKGFYFNTTYWAKKMRASTYKLYIQTLHRWSSSELKQQNDFSPFYCKKDNFKDFKYWDFNSIKHKWKKLLNLNYVANNCTWHTCVTWKGTNYELPEGDTLVSKHVGVW
jgi:hypothetical protein